MKKSNELIVKQDEENEVPTEVIAASIVSISEGIKKLRSGRLNDEALLLLIQNACPKIKGNSYAKVKPSITTVAAVLRGMESLSKTYIK